MHRRYARSLSLHLTGPPRLGFQSSCSPRQPHLGESPSGTIFFLRGRAQSGTLTQTPGTSTSGPPKWDITSSDRHHHSSQINFYEVAVCFEVNWCSTQGKDPQRCTNSMVISFLKERLEVWLSLSTLKVYMAAKSCTSPCNQEAHLIFRFLRGAMRFNPLMPYSLLGSSLWC